jgi:hypothetical protein
MANGETMTQQEFSRRGGHAKSQAKLTAANHNLAKAQKVRKEKLAAAAAAKRFA